MKRITFGGRTQYLNQMPKDTKFYPAPNFVENQVGNYEPIKNVIRKRINVYKCWMAIFSDCENVDEDLLIHDDDIFIPEIPDYEFGDKMAYIGFVILKRQEISLEPYISRWSTCLFVPKHEQGRVFDVVRRFGKRKQWNITEFDAWIANNLAEVGTLWIDNVTHIAYPSVLHILKVPQGRQYSYPMHTWESDMWLEDMSITFEVKRLILPRP